MAKIQTTKIHYLQPGQIVGVTLTGFTAPVNPNRKGMGTAIKTNYNLVLDDGRTRRVLSLVVPHAEPQHYVLIKNIRHFLTPECHARMALLERFSYPIDPYSVDDFTRGYMAAALFTTSDEDDEDGNDPLSARYDISDFAPDVLADIVVRCLQFQNDNAELLAAAYAHPKYYSKDGSTVESLAGHDFWLTHNGHGAGYWDGDLNPHEDESRDIGELLTQASSRYREIDLQPYNGKVYAL